MLMTSSAECVSLTGWMMRHSAGSAAAAAAAAASYILQVVCCVTLAQTSQLACLVP
jgi:hypothetical protein